LRLTWSSGKNMNLDEAKAVFLDLLNSLESMPVNPWPFLCASALIEYLTKMVNGDGSGAEKYKQFVSTYLARVNPLYNSFTYIYGSPSPEQDLPRQMYHILRCGIVHSFSFIPDKQATDKGGRPRSVLIAHEVSISLLIGTMGKTPRCLFSVTSLSI
jgi:hypothetical protein